MKTFEKFLKESYVGKDGNIYASKSEAEKTIAKINRLSDSERVTKGLEGADPSKQLKGQSSNIKTRNVSKPPVTRFDPTEPFQDYDNVTTDRVSNKPPTQTSKVVLGPDGKPLAYKGKNIPVTEPKAGETMIKGIKDADLEKKALDQTRKDLLKQKVDTKPVTTTKNVVKKGPSQAYLNLQKKARGVLKNLKKEAEVEASDKTTIKPKIEKKFTITEPSSATKNIGKNVTTQTTSPKVVTKSFSDLWKDVKRATTQVTTGVGEVPKKVNPVTKVLQRTGLTVDKTIKPDNIGKSTRQVPKVTGNVVKAATKSSTKKVLGKVFTGFGRAATGAVAVSDYLDTAKKEKAKGRGKTSQVVGGLSKALGGYIGGGIGAGLGGLAGGGVGSFATGTAGAIAGYELGSRAGEKLYNVGRKIATGQKTFKQLRSDIVGASKDLKDKTVRTTKNLYNTGKKKVSDFIKDK